MTRRMERLNDLLRAELSDLLRRGAKDPRLSGFVTITEVEVSADLRHARVFVSVLGSEAEKEETLCGFEQASGFLRHELSMRLTLRRIPELTFCKDDSIERGSHLLQLMKELAPPEPPPKVEPRRHSKRQ